MSLVKHSPNNFLPTYVCESKISHSCCCVNDLISPRWPQRPRCQAENPVGSWDVGNDAILIAKWSRWMCSNTEDLLWNENPAADLKFRYWIFRQDFHYFDTFTALCLVGFSLLLASLSLQSSRYRALVLPVKRRYAEDVDQRRSDQTSPSSMR